MDSSVKARPNHYELLGVTPTASPAEIAQAFTKKMSAFAARPLAVSAQLSIAFETLRDPERRKAYDASLRPPPPPKPAVPQPAYTLRWSPAPFMAAAVAVPPARPAPPKPRAGALVEPKPAPFVAAPAPVAQAPEERQEPEPQRPEPFVEPQRVIERVIERGPAARPNARPLGLNRTAMAIGGVVLGVGMLGAVAGWSAGLVEQPAPEDRVTLALPRAKPITTAASVEPAPAWTGEQARSRRPRSAAVSRLVRSAPAAPPLLPLEELQADASQSAQSDNGPALAETPGAAVVPASLSLSKPVIARTIGRIGYPCGEVASTSAVEGGRFKVTCTSGHSYQATSVRGRYHFRRWNSR